MRWLLSILTVATVFFQSAPVVAGPYAACAESLDPPDCLIRQALAVDPDEASQVLQSAVVAGSVDVLMSRPDETLAAVDETMNLSASFLKALGLEMEPRPAVDASQRREVVLAGVVVATLAAIQSDPLVDSRVMRLAPSADDQAAAAMVAVQLWDEIDPYRDFGAIGRASVWKRVLASPPASEGILVDLAQAALTSGFRDEGLALIALLRARPAASAGSRAASASMLARYERRWAEADALMAAGGAAATGYDIDGIWASISAARLYSGYDKAAALRVLQTELSKMPDNGFYDFSIVNALEPLGRAGATNELGQLGDAYLVVARSTELSAEDRTDWYALASEAYRLAGRQNDALAAAREGVRLVPVAVHARAGGLVEPGETPSSDSLPTTPQARLEELVDANGVGGRPVVALYRAGAWQEALDTGYLSGFDRYLNAEIAGEPADAGWVVADRSWFWVRVQTLGLEDDPAAAGRMHDVLLANRSLYLDVDEGDWEVQLGVLSGIARRRDEMIQHFRHAAEGLDRVLASPDQEDSKASAFFALDLAAQWATGLRRTAPH